MKFYISLALVFLLIVGKSQEFSRIKLETIAEKSNIEFQKNQQKAASIFGERLQPHGMTIDGIVYTGDSHGASKFIEAFGINQLTNSNVDLVHNNPDTGLSATGSGITIYQWDGGRVLDTHQEFGGRVTNLEPVTSPISSHATVVAGVEVAQGVNANAKGMAPSAILKAYNFGNNLTEIASESALPENAEYMISNHSYGFAAGWAFGSYDSDLGQGWYWFGTPWLNEQESALFGLYIENDSIWDDIAYHAPKHLMIKAAGNDRNDAPNPVSHFTYDENFDWVTSTTSRAGDCAVTGYDCLLWGSVGKNVMIVGSANPITSTSGNRYTQPSDVVAAAYSSFGPTDDGRIKPEVVAVGSAVTSPTGSSNTAYNTNAHGTSYAAPAVAGIAALLQEIYFNQTGNYLDSSTLRAIIANTAYEAGPNPGPDYGFGYGLVNALDAANYVLELGQNSEVVEETLNQGETLTYDIYARAQSMKVALAWLDPPSPAPELAFNNRTPLLINDLDLRIVDTVTNEVFMPWVLNPDVPSAAATKGDNSVDNLEQVVIENTVEGRKYMVEISHKGTLQGGTQNIGLVMDDATYAPLSISEVAPEIKIKAYPNPVANILYVNLENTNLKSLKIIDYTGRVFEQLTSIDTKNLELNVTKLPVGQYMLIAETETGLVSTKFIKD